MEFLPAPVLANILECLSDAGEVVRAAASCKALWAAAAGPLTQVHRLEVRHCTAPDLHQQQLQALHGRFPNIQQLLVADGCWSWTGSDTLATWATTLTSLQASSSSFPLLAALPLQCHSSVEAARVPGLQQQRTPAGRDVSACSNRQPGRQATVQLARQLGPPAVAPFAIPWQLRGLSTLQLRGCVSSPVRCTRHASTDCHCMEHTVLAALLQQNAGLSVLDLGGNSCLPDRLCKAAFQAATCRSLHSLSMAGCELLAASSFLHMYAAFPELQQLDISNTAATDLDIQLLAVGLQNLTFLSLHGCRRVADAGVLALAAAPAMLNGTLRSLDVGRLTRPSARAMSTLMAAWAAACSAAALRGTCSSSSSRGSSGSGGMAGSGTVFSVHHTRPLLLHMGCMQAAGVTDAALLGFMGASCPATAVSSPQQQNSSDAMASCAEAEAAALQQQLEGLVLNTTAVHQGPCPPHEQLPPMQQSQLSVGVPRVRLCGLHLASCNFVSSDALLQLGAAGVLSALTSLDLSDMEAFRQPVQQHQMQQLQTVPAELAQVTASCAGNAAGLCDAVTCTSCKDSGAASSSSGSGSGADGSVVVGSSRGSGSGADGPVIGSSSGSVSSAAPSRSTLALLLQHTGHQLRVLALDGCFMDDAAALAIARQGLPLLVELSLVGCRGLGDAGLRQLLHSLTGLQQLALGGSASAWSEGGALPGLPVLGSLTQVKLIRRPVLTDAELASVLAATSRLRSLSLVGCYLLTDKLFEMATVGGSRQDTAGLPGGSSTSGIRGQGCAAAGASPTQHVEGRGPLLQQLTQLCLSACDGVTGGSIGRLGGLRHLRVAFCASLSPSAVQHLIVRCTRLTLLELPVSLSGQRQGYQAIQFGSSGACAVNRTAVAGGSVLAGGDTFEAGIVRRHQGINSGRRACQASSPSDSSGRAHPIPLVLPQLRVGCAEHLQGLKVVWI